jgi:hypothetical protein
MGKKPREARRICMHGETLKPPEQGQAQGTEPDRGRDVAVVRRLLQGRGLETFTSDSTILASKQYSILPGVPGVLGVHEEAEAAVGLRGCGTRYFKTVVWLHAPPDHDGNCATSTQGGRRAEDGEWTEDWRAHAISIVCERAVQCSGRYSAYLLM